MGPSYRIVFYISGHGFGHSARSIELIHALLRREPAAAITVKALAPRRLFDETLGGRIDLIPMACDSGMVQLDSLTVDVDESIRRAKEFQRRLPELVETESRFLKQAQADVVVGDIPPLAFGAAAACGVPSAAIGNFTWDWIYESYPDKDTEDLVADIRRHYRQATVALRLPMAGGFTGVESIVQEIPFIARHSRREPDDIRRALGLPARTDGLPLVLMSFGGYGVEGLDTEAVGGLEGFTVATTDIASGANRIKSADKVLCITAVRLDASGLCYEDLVRAADVVVTKPGYGIITEAVANRAAILYTSRGRFVEYDVLVREMPRYLPVEFIERQDLLSGNWSAALRRLLRKPWPAIAPSLDGADVAAEAILKIARK